MILTIKICSFLEMSTVTDCGCITCSDEHKFLQVNGFLKLNITEIHELQRCLSIECEFCCGFCETFIDCRRIEFFHSQLTNYNLIPNKKIYDVFYKVILYNGKDLVWRPHTVDLHEIKFISDGRLVNKIFFKINL